MKRALLIGLAIGIITGHRLAGWVCRSAEVAWPREDTGE